MSTWYVRKTGNDGNGGTDPDTDAKLTIGSAEGLGTDKDIIDIGEGTWTEEFGDVDREYQGADMFNTVIQGYLPTTSKASILKDLTVEFTHNHGSTISGGMKEYYRVFVKGEGYGQSSGYHYYPIRAYYCVFDDMNGGSGYEFLLMSEIDIRSCVFNNVYKVYGNNVARTSYLVNNVFKDTQVMTFSLNKYNNVYNNMTNRSSDLNTTSMDPTFNNFYSDFSFEDEANYDFRLPEGSDGIGAGFPVKEV